MGESMGDDNRMEDCLELDWWLQLELCHLLTDEDISFYQDGQTSSVLPGQGQKTFNPLKDICENMNQDGFLELGRLPSAEERHSEVERNQRCLKLMSSGTVVVVPEVMKEEVMEVVQEEVDLSVLSHPSVCNAREMQGWRTEREI